MHPHNENKKTCILIPALEPDESLLTLIEHIEQIKLKNLFFFEPDILIVNDGSKNTESLRIIKRIAELDSVMLISHDKNLGKGASLKTGIMYLSDKNISYLVTADADGQHSAMDIFRVLEESVKSKKIVFGSRDFSGKNIPFKSKLGNKLTSLVLNLFTGKKIKDTQTGLRAFPSEYFSSLVSTEGQKYEFEFNSMMSIAKTHDITYLPIETLYFENNKKSHFRPFIDSLLIYFVFFRHFSVAFTISVIDFLLIYLVFLIYPQTLSFLIIRVLTVYFYFYFMRTTVFKSKSKIFNQFLRFCLVAFINIFISLFIFERLFFQEQKGFLLAYFAAVIVVYFLNFLAQRNFIFK